MNVRFARTALGCALLIGAALAHARARAQDASELAAPERIEVEKAGLALP